MPSYPVHTIDTAPERSRPALQTLKQSFGFIPNLAATMAGSPPLVNSFVSAFGQFHGGSFTSGQRQVLLLTNAVANASPWAVAFHSTLALKEGVDAEDVRAIREKRLPQERKLARLSALTRALVERRGHIDERDLTAFLETGFTSDQVLEVIAGIAISAMANYAGNVAHPPLEDKFKGQAWEG